MEYEALQGAIWAKGTFWVTFAVLLFLFFFGRQIFNYIVGMLDRRASGISEQLEEARRLRAEAEAMLRDAEARKKEAEAQARDMIAAAAREAERLAADLVEEAHAAAKRREKMAQERIDAARNAAVGEIQQRAAALSSRAAELLLRETVDAAHDQGLVDNAIAGMPDALRRRAA